MLAAQFYEVNCISRHTDSKLRIFLGMFHCIEQHFAVEHIHIQVVRTLCKLTVHHCHKILHASLVVHTQRLWNNRECVAYSIL